ncbi:hypothetical protein PRK78_002008 [Emydomyces testavorans]|uniref:Uncharacterized protein n=1 Tax=Emydomyces testavorans TaxID=2070801 RepID=A0AAF0IH80_9EURO|nr:hypothetical protein PRK78_002008 [Emydomyces testavorans]
MAATSSRRKSQKEGQNSLLIRDVADLQQNADVDGDFAQLEKPILRELVVEEADTELSQSHYQR